MLKISCRAWLSCCFAFLLAACLFSGPAWAGESGQRRAASPASAIPPRLEAPDRVARGDAFLALAVSETPVNTFIFHWMGKTLTALAEPVEGGAAGRPLWQGVVLLPVPLDAGEAALELAVTPGGGAGAPRAVARLDLYDKNRPVQKLTVDKKYVDPPAAEQARIRADREKVRRALAQPLPERLWTLPFTRPVPGDVSSLFGLKRVFNGQPRGVHRGLDLRGSTGTPILACAPGKVVLADELYFSGKVVYINHGAGVFTAYLHMSKIDVESGQTVAGGQVIGLVGATGRVTGPHLHLSLLVQGVAVDPEPLLAPRPAGTVGNGPPSRERVETGK